MTAGILLFFMRTAVCCLVQNVTLLPPPLYLEQFLCLTAFLIKVTNIIANTFDGSSQFDILRSSPWQECNLLYDY